MRIIRIEKDKKLFLELLLLADEQENMIDRYLEQGEMYALFDNSLKSVCVVTDRGLDECELKNIATYQKDQGKGYGKHLLHYVMQSFRNRFKTMYVGTGDNAGVISFYEHLGFIYSHRVENFFVDYYDHPIFENGKQLIDMVYLKKEL